MALVPESSIDESSLSASVQTSRTYAVDFDSNIIEGTYDKINAVIQAVYKILSTERYKYVVYDRSYGIEIEDLIGKPPVYVSAVIKGRITEALMCDERILSVENFEITQNRGSITVEFTVKTIFGDSEAVKNFVI